MLGKSTRLAPTSDLNGVCPTQDCQNNGKYQDGKCVCVGKFFGNVVRLLTK